MLTLIDGGKIIRLGALLDHQKKLDNTNWECLKAILMNPEMIYGRVK